MCNIYIYIHVHIPTNSMPCIICIFVSCLSGLSMVRSLSCRTCYWKSPEALFCHSPELTRKCIVVYINITYKIHSIFIMSCFLYIVIYTCSIENTSMLCIPWHDNEYIIIVSHNMTSLIVASHKMTCLLQYHLISWC